MQLVMKWTWCEGWTCISADRDRNITIQTFDGAIRKSCEEAVDRWESWPVVIDTADDVTSVTKDGDPSNIWEAFTIKSVVMPSMPDRGGLA